MVKAPHLNIPLRFHDLLLIQQVHRMQSQLPELLMELERHGACHQLKNSTHCICDLVSLPRRYVKLV